WSSAGGPLWVQCPGCYVAEGGGGRGGREFSILTAWCMKLLVSLVVRERRLLYLFPEGSRSNRL
ncbi:hypothetical protein AALO_G00207520, partial [Alosa alosa]